MGNKSVEAYGCRLLFLQNNVEPLNVPVIRAAFV